MVSETLIASVVAAVLLLVTLAVVTFLGLSEQLSIILEMVMLIFGYGAARAVQLNK